MTERPVGALEAAFAAYRVQEGSAGEACDLARQLMIDALEDAYWEGAARALLIHKTQQKTCDELLGEIQERIARKTEEGN